MQHIFQCLVSRKTTLKILGRSQNVFLKVFLQVQFLRVPNLLLFLLICQKNIAVAMQLNKVVKKKTPHHTTKTRRQPPTYRMFLKPKEAGCKLDALSTVRTLWCKLRSLCSLKTTSIALHKMGCLWSVFSPLSPVPQKLPPS